MSLSHRIVLPLAIVSLALLVACGNSNNGPAPNQQGFTTVPVRRRRDFFLSGPPLMGTGLLVISEPKRVTT